MSKLISRRPAKEQAQGNRRCSHHLPRYSIFLAGPRLRLVPHAAEHRQVDVLTYQRQNSN